MEGKKLVQYNKITIYDRERRKIMKRKGLSILLTAAMLAGTFGSFAVNVSAAEEEVTLTVVEAVASPARTEAIRALCDKFEESHPGVTVELISPPAETSNTKIAQMFMAEEKIDVIDLRDQTFAQYTNNGWIGTLDEYIEGWAGLETLSESAKYYMNAFADETYWLPYGFFMKGLYYRADWFEEAGIKVPETWEELIDAAIAFTDPENNRYGYSFRGGTNGYEYLNYLIDCNLGADALSSMIHNVFVEGGTIFGTEEALASAEQYKKLYEEGSPKDAVAWGFTEMVQGFIGGTTAMLLQDPEVIVSCQEGMEDGTWSIAPMPKGASGQGLVPTGVGGWAITSHTEMPDLAAEFVLFMSEEENNSYFAETYSIIPVHTSAFENSEVFSQPIYDGFEKMMNDAASYPATSAPYQYQAYSVNATQADEYVQNYLMGNVTAEELLGTFDAFWKEALEAEGKLWE